MSTVPQFVVDHLNEKREDIQALALTMKDMVAEFRSIERFAGVPAADLGFIFGPPEAKVEPVKAKPVGFSNKEDQLTKAVMVSRFGYLLNLEPVDRVREAVKIHLENPGLNHSHLSRSLGQHSSWFGQLMYRARNKGML